MKWVFQISSQRSGSSFLAQIINSHPQVRIYNEVFRHRPEIMPHFKKALDSGSEDFKKEFESDLRKLSKYQFSSMNNLLHRQKVVKFLFFGALKSCANVLLRTGFIRSGSFFHLVYHLNLLHEPLWAPFYFTQFEKERTASIFFFKEVQLWKAYTSYQRLQPNGYFIYLLRNPYFTIASDIKHRNIRDLDDLKTVDKNLYLRDDLFGKPDLVERFFDAGVEQRLALQWRLENEFVYKDLKSGNIPNSKILLYEDLVSNPKGNAEEIFRFLGLEYPQQADQYLGAVSRFKGQQKHALSTFISRRDLRRRAQEPELNAEQKARIGSVLEGCPLMDLWF